MHKLHPIRLFPILLAFLLFSTDARTQEREAAAKTPTAVRDVLYARPFTLDTGFLFTWVPERPTVERGLIVVVRVDPALVVPTDAPEPILYAGEQVVERLNWGHLSGHVIAVIPGSFDLTSAPIWFGSPGLPGRVPVDEVRAELETVERRGEKISAARVAAITEPEIHARDFAELLRGELADLVLRFSPQESDLAEKWRLPEARVEDDPRRPPAVDDGGGKSRGDETGQGGPTS